MLLSILFLSFLMLESKIWKFSIPHFKIANSMKEEDNKWQFLIIKA